MKYFNPAWLTLSLLAGCAANPASAGTGGQPAFRVRTDFGAALNSDQGWSGALNENVSVPADRPFRVRLEVEQPPGAAVRGPFRLQYRRNGGDWADVEAHDFPHPVRELELDFAKADAGVTPEGWRVTPDDADRMIVASDGQAKVCGPGRAGNPSLVSTPRHGPRPNSRQNFDCPPETEMALDSFSAM